MINQTFLRTMFLGHVECVYHIDPQQVLHIIPKAAVRKSIKNKKNNYLIKKPFKKVLFVSGIFFVYSSNYLKNNNLNRKSDKKIIIACNNVIILSQLFRCL